MEFMKIEDLMPGDKIKFNIEYLRETAFYSILNYVDKVFTIKNVEISGHYEKLIISVSFIEENGGRNQWSFCPYSRINFSLYRRHFPIEIIELGKD